VIGCLEVMKGIQMNVTSMNLGEMLMKESKKRRESAETESKAF